MLRWRITLCMLPIGTIVTRAFIITSALTPRSNRGLSRKMDIEASPIGIFDKLVAVESLFGRGSALCTVKVHEANRLVVLVTTYACPEKPFARTE